MLASACSHSDSLGSKCLRDVIVDLGVRDLIGLHGLRARVRLRAESRTR